MTSLKARLQLQFWGVPLQVGYLFQVNDKKHNLDIGEQPREKSNENIKIIDGAKCQKEWDNTRRGGGHT